MNKNFLLQSVGVFFICLFTCSAFAQSEMSSDGVQSFQADQSAWRRGGAASQAENENNTPLNMLPIFQQNLSSAAISNIINAENVFCYHVQTVPEGYLGYTLDGMAVTGYCGMIGNNLRNVLFRLFFATDEFIDTRNVAQCVMEPKLIFRYVRGVDYTDVLVSSPCHALAVFYGGKVVTYNFAPVAQVFDAMVSFFAEQNMGFVSPALLNQIVPVGYPLTAEQQQVVQQSRTQNTVLKKTSQQSVTSVPQSGWNNLKVNIQR